MKGIAAGGFKLTHGQIKQQIVPKLVNVIVVWWFGDLFCFLLQICSALPQHCFGFTRLGGTLEGHRCCPKVGAGPQGRGSILSARLGIFFVLFRHLMKQMNRTKRCLGAIMGTAPVMSCLGFLPFLKILFWCQICLLRFIHLLYPVTCTDKDVPNTS